MILLYLTLATAEPPKTRAPDAERPSGFVFKYKEKKWKEALIEVAKPLGLSIQMDFDPPGSFTYSDPKSYTPEQALELLHGELLDRGVTLIRSQNALLGVRLADNLHQNLTPFTPAEEIRQRKDNLAVFTTIKLNSIAGKDAKTELLSFLSPRGRIAETAMPSRIAVWDRCDFVRDLLNVIERIDPPGKGAAVPLRTYALKHARAQDAAELAKKVLGMDKPKGPQQPQPGMPAIIANVVPDFGRMGRELGTRKMAESFAPGVSLKGMVPESPVADAPVLELAVDEARNLLMARGDRTRLALVDRVVAGLERPDYDPNGGAEVEIRTYTLPAPDGEKFAEALRKAMQESSTFFAAGAENRLLVKGTRKQLLEVEATLKRMAPASMRFASFDVPPAAAELLAEQLAKLFEKEAKENRPTIAADPELGKLLVRGSELQLAQIRRFVEATYPPALVAPAGSK
jgi:type II secretory pathway component GspD/PulD (secretin)